MNELNQLTPVLKSAAEAALRCATSIDILAVNASTTAHAVDRSLARAQGAREKEGQNGARLRDDYIPTQAEPIEASYSEHGKTSFVKLSAACADLRASLAAANGAHIGAIPGKKVIGEHAVVSVHHGVLAWAEDLIKLVLWHTPEATHDSPAVLLPEYLDQFHIHWESIARTLAKDKRMQSANATLADVRPMIVQEAIVAQRNMPDPEEVEDDDYTDDGPEPSSDVTICVIECLKKGLDRQAIADRCGTTKENVSTIKRRYKSRWE